MAAAMATTPIARSNRLILRRARSSATAVRRSTSLGSIVMVEPHQLDFEFQLDSHLLPDDALDFENQ